MDKYLAIIICNKSYSTDVITVARNHGAKGGTVLDGRGTANDQDMMFFQKYIQREKEVIFIVLDKSNKDDIVNTIDKELGPKTDAHALSVVLNVESLNGFQNLM